MILARRTEWLWLLGAGVVVAASSIAILWLAGRIGVGTAVVIPLALIGGICLILVPVSWLPSIALVLYLFIPRTTLSLNDLLSTLTPSFMVVIIWGIRSVRTESRDDPGPSALLKVLCSLTFLWLLLSMVTHRGQLSSLAWSLDFAVMVLMVLLVPLPARAIEQLQTTFLWSSIVMLGICGVEFAAGSNIILDPLYRTLGIPDVQHWSVYRAAGTLGHPLYAGLFFSMVFGLSFGKRVESGKNVYLWFAAASLLGILLTVSRNSLGAVAATIAVVIIPSLFARTSLSMIGKLSIAVLAVAGAIAVTQAPIFQDRLDSQEAIGSTNARNVVVDLAIQASARHGWVGSGPSTSIVSTTPFNPNGVIIENAYLQLLISLGIPGLLLIAALLGGGAVRAIRTGSYGALGALVAYMFSVGFFNIMESSRPSLILAGLVLLMAWRSNPESNAWFDSRSVSTMRVRA